MEIGKITFILVNKEFRKKKKKEVNKECVNILLGVRFINIYNYFVSMIIM